MMDDETVLKLLYDTRTQDALYKLLRLAKDLALATPPDLKDALDKPLCPSLSVGEFLVNLTILSKKSCPNCGYHWTESH